MLIFLKLGGSLITDKYNEQTVNHEVLTRICNEIASALNNLPNVNLLIGHGSGSFGHKAASKFGTRDGVFTQKEWYGFGEVCITAARLNMIVYEALQRAQVPVIRFQPSASAKVIEGQIMDMSLRPIEKALSHNLVPLVYGDVAFDEKIGGTIISTEEIFSYLSKHLKPQRILLAGSYDGVEDESKKIIPLITPSNFPSVLPALGGSHADDVTGGMVSKVQEMLHLCQTIESLTVTIFSGLKPGAIKESLLNPDIVGTTIKDHESNDS